MKCLDEKQYATYCLEKILESAPHKTAAKWPLTPILQTIQERQTRHVGHHWRSNDKLKREVFLWTPTHGHTILDRQAITYIHLLCADT